MSHDKSSKKDATDEFICDISDKQRKYKLFAAITDRYWQKGEAKTQFMSRIGMPGQRSMFSEFYKGERHVTDGAFDHIRRSLQWSAKETQEFERLLEIDHDTLKGALNAKKKPRHVLQVATDVEETVAVNELDPGNDPVDLSIEPNSSPPSTPDELIENVRVRDWNDIIALANPGTFAGRLLLFCYLFEGGTIKDFATKRGIGFEYFRDMVSAAASQQTGRWKMDVVDKIIGACAPQGLGLWVLTGEPLLNLEEMLQEYRAWFHNRLGEVLASKESGCSGS